MTRKRLGSIDRDSVADMRTQAEAAAAERRVVAGLTAPPIGQVARNAAQSLEEELLRLRKENTGMKGVSEAFSKAQRERRILEHVALDQIDPHAFSRDRRQIDPESEDWQALRSSIAARGQQTPIEITGRSSLTGKYGLVSGYRRWSCLRELHAETGEDRFATVLAMIAPPRESVDSMLAMIEENEIRADISFYERGRICCLAAEQGVCQTVDAAIEALFPNSSRNRRYKIRNFTLIHQRLAGLLDFPEAIGERLGAKLAQALKDGREGPLFEALKDRDQRFDDAAEELALLEAFVAGRAPFAAEKPAEPAVRAQWTGAGGRTLRGSAKNGRVSISFDAKDLHSAEALEVLLARVGAALDD